MINTKMAIQKVESLLNEWTISATCPESFRFDPVISPQNFYEAVNTLVENNWGYLSAITGIDRPAAALDEDTGAEDQIEVLYHFSEGEAVTTLHVYVPYSHLELESICDLIPSASMYERELMEMLGINIAGTPDRRKLVLPNEWPDGVYPFRKSFTGLNDVKFKEIK